MENLNENKFILINTQKTIFENIINEFKELVNKNRINKNEINLYLRKLYNKETEKYDKMIIHTIYNKKIKSVKEFSFIIIIDENFPKNPPIIYCDYIDININLNDRRDLLNSIIEKKWMMDDAKINCVDILLYLIEIKIPDFILRLINYEENKILVYYGKYYINEIYNINDFLKNKNIKIFKAITYKMDKESLKYSELNNKYIIITDIYILFFDLMDDKPKNLAKLIFVGEIFQYNTIERLEVDINNNSIFNLNNNIFNNNDENNLISIDPHKILIDWVFNNKNCSFILSIITEINPNEKKDIIKENYRNNNEEIIDFINIVNKKQNILSTQYKVVINDYNQFESINSSIESFEDFSDKILNNLIELAKYIEKLKNKKINANKVNLKEDNQYNSELNKIYNKIINISCKINKIETTFEYLDKLELFQTKKINIYKNYDNFYYEGLRDMGIDKKDEKNKYNFLENKKDENKLKNENIHKNEGNNKTLEINDNKENKEISSINNNINNININSNNNSKVCNIINNNNDNSKNNIKEKNLIQNKIQKSNTMVYKKDEIIKKDINNKNIIKKDNENKPIYNKKNTNKKNSISSLIQMFENKKD